MRLQSASYLLSALLPSLASASGFDCAHIKLDNYKYDLSPLKGVHEITHSVTTDDYVTNTTYRLNICNILGKNARFGEATCESSRNGTFCHGRDHPEATVLPMEENISN
jgi:hypothetical protein